MIGPVLDKKLVLQAVKSLREINEKYFKSAEKISLLEDETKCPLYLQLSLQKIPKTKLIKRVKVLLPHSLITPTTEVCLITGDLDKNNKKSEIQPDILHYQDLLKEKHVQCISKVMTLRQLRTEYKPFEAKQKLLGAFDIFLADNKIYECLPRVLGKHFFRKRKFPIQINLRAANLKEHIEKALSSVIFHITGHGNCCLIEVARLDMKDSEILENILAIAKIITEKLPGSWDNVMGMYLKTAKSTSIPIYVSYGNPNDVTLEDETEETSFCVDELNTLPNAKVKVFADGRVHVMNIKGEKRQKGDGAEKISEAYALNSDIDSEVDVKLEGQSTQIKSEPTYENIQNTSETDPKKTPQGKKNKKMKVQDSNAEISSECSDVENEEDKKVQKKPELENIIRERKIKKRKSVPVEDSNDKVSSQFSNNENEEDHKMQRRSQKNISKLTHVTPGACSELELKIKNMSKTKTKKKRVVPVQDPDDKISSECSDIENEEDKKVQKKTELVNITKERKIKKRKSLPAEDSSDKINSRFSDIEKKKKVQKKSEKNISKYLKAFDTYSGPELKLENKTKKLKGKKKEYMPVHDPDDRISSQYSDTDSEEENKIQEKLQKIIAEFTYKTSDNYSQSELKTGNMSKERKIRKKRSLPVQDSNDNPKLGIKILEKNKKSKKLKNEDNSEKPVSDLQVKCAPKKKKGNFTGKSGKKIFSR